MLESLTQHPYWWVIGREPRRHAEEKTLFRYDFHELHERGKTYFVVRLVVDISFFTFQTRRVYRRSNIVLQ